MKDTKTVAALSCSLLCASTSLAAAVKSSPLNLPLNEAFTSSTLDPAWTVHLAKGSTLEVRDGAIEIRAGATSPAHIERALNVDLFRAACSIKPGTDGAAPALLVWWDKANFCQIGVGPGRASTMRVREVLGTYPDDYDVAPWPIGECRSVAIEVARDCIRYLARGDGVDFKCLHISRRPERFAGAPKLLIIGEGAETNVFPSPNPWMEPPSQGLADSWVRDVQVLSLEGPRRQASAEEQRALEAGERDELGEQELSAGEDPTFESVSRHFPPLKWPREIVGVKDHPHDIGVAPDGALQLTDDIANYTKPTAFFEIGEPSCRFGSGPTPCRRRLLNGYMPIVVLRDEHDGLVLEQTVFGHSAGLSPDQPLSGYLRLQVTNSSEATRAVKVRLCVRPAVAKSPPTWRLEMPGHASRAVYARIPFAIRESPAAEVSAEEFDAKLAEVTAYWDQLLQTGSRFEIPEPRVQDAYRAWLAYNFLNVAKRGDVYHVCDGSGFYTQVYGYSAALYCRTLDLMGYHDLAAVYLDSLLTFVQPSGLLAVNSGDSDTGGALYALSEHYRVTRDADWLQRVAPRMTALCNWIIESRRSALAATQPAVTRGLIRYRPYADHTDPAADYFSNGHLCKGLAATADVFAEIGMSDEASRLSRAAEQYRADITASMRAAVFTDRGMQILPVIPDTRELWHESNESANGYYGLLAPCVLEAGLPAAGSSEANLLINAIRGRGGLVLGVCRFHNLIDHAYSYAYWMECMRRGEPKRAVLGLYSSMAYGMSRETYSAVECTAIRNGQNYWTLPHTYSNTQQLTLLRNMLLREEGDELLIGDAIPRPWLAAGQRVAIQEAPTIFGPASVTIESGAEAIRIHLAPPTRNPPRAVKIRLRHPGQRSIQSVLCEPHVDVSFKDDLVTLLGPSRAVDLLVNYEK